MTAQVQDTISDDLVALRGVATRGPGPLCAVQKLAEHVEKEVSPEAARAIAAAADDVLIQPAVLSRYVEDKFGVSIKPLTINRHRRRGSNPNSCRCPE